MDHCQYCHKYLFNEKVFYYTEKTNDYKIKRHFCSKKCLTHYLVDSLLYCDNIINDKIINDIDGEDMIIFSENYRHN